ncbi:MAG: signal peptidase I [Verrucomicrobiales bacterium]
MPAPPPLPHCRSLKSRFAKIGIGFYVVLGIAASILVVGLIVMRVSGLLRPFGVPTGSMSPAISPGDQVLMEGMSYLWSEPRRGNVAIFRTAGIEAIRADTIYVMRIAGEPGDRLRIAQGKLFVNGEQVTLLNAAGNITSFPPPSGRHPLKTDVTVPEGHYFMLGDNSANSFDSRYWGFVPRQNIMGRVFLRHWPLTRAGAVK